MGLHRTILKQMGAVFLLTALMGTSAGWTVQPLSAAAAERPASSGGNGVTVVLDPGHQAKADLSTEPVAPDSKERKEKVTGGARGVSTGIYEYQMNLDVSFLLRDRLEERGYKVVMTRETHDVHLSNIERAEIGNREQADLVVRIHADSSESSSVEGISVLYPARERVGGSLSDTSKEAAAGLLDALLEHTGAASRGLAVRSDLTGFNWSKVPTVLVEMGFLSNPREDRLMATGAYREKLADGMADGIDRYFAAQEDRLQVEPWEGAVLPLTGDTPLYGREGRIFTPLGTAVSSQPLHATGRSGSWYRIETWLGPAWIKGGPDCLEQVTVPEGKSLDLNGTTVLYDRPDGGRELGALAPQSVEVRYEWNGWSCIGTWLGLVWIRP